MNSGSAVFLILRGYFKINVSKGVKKGIFMKLIYRSTSSEGSLIKIVFGLIFALAGLGFMILGFKTGGPPAYFMVPFSSIFVMNIRMEYSMLINAYVI